jgi:GDP-4-dehydro-6-deoxy-D-mannose reductase
MTGDVRVLITGGEGFVAPYAAQAILDAIKGAALHVTARRKIVPPVGCAVSELDILDTPSVLKILRDFRPTHVLHLAGIASRAAAEANPTLAWRVNVSATLELAHQFDVQCNGGSFLFVSSSQVYSADQNSPLSEMASIGPQGVYPSTKAAADLALGAMESKGLRIIRFRPFNHTGPGQAEAYAFGSFARQISNIENGKQPPLITVGNLDIKRDFLDVRDVADAYALGILNSPKLPPNSIFNLASEQPRSIADLLNCMLSNASLKIKIQVDPKLQRRNEVDIVSGDSSKARKSLNWLPVRSMEKTMGDMLDYARKNTSQDLTN